MLGGTQEQYDFCRPSMPEEQYLNFVSGFSAVADKDISVALELARECGQELPAAENSLALMSKVYRAEY